MGLGSWWRERKRKSLLAAPPAGELREFVYIDDVSVQSLLASRSGAVATDYTSTDTTGQKRQRGVDFGSTQGPVKAGYKGSREASTSYSAQVIRKSSEQARFKELLDSEQKSLVLNATEAFPAASASPRGALVEVAPTLEELASSHPHHIVAEELLRRGALVEIEVELEAEPIYGVSAAISALIALFEQTPEMVPEADRESVRQVSAIAKMLDQLLTDLVPVRGPAINYRVLHRAGQAFLIHKDLAARLPEDERRALEPLVVVGVAQHDLFWKDIRRVLFASQRYTVMARIAADGLHDAWQPIKLVDLVEQVSPELADMLSGASTQVLESLYDSTHLPTGDPAQRRADRAHVAYRDLLAHELGVDSQDAARLCDELPASAVVPTGSESFRASAAAITEALLAQAGQSQAPESLARLREAAWQSSVRADASSTAAAPPQEAAAHESYLNVEFVAIYW